MQIHIWEQIPKEQLNEKLTRRFVTGENVMLAEIGLAEGAVVPEHSHEAEQITNLVKGALEFDMQGEKRVLRAGECIVIPSNVPHSVRALEDSVALDLFSPIRHDWISGDDSYLRR